MDSETVENATVSQIATDRAQISTCRTKMIEQQNLENFQIIWLDDNINTTEDNLHTVSLLRTIINYLHIFDNIWDCYDYIGTVQDEKVFLIVSGSISENIIPYVYHIPQVQFVYIYCFDVEKHKKWEAEYGIVRGI
ncbi:unnamed protein product [Rotaria magnacalcarata]|uniref:Uncharacterized protein n=1 Tax=Rotaria magnacalcarata TaxID=392030 RepID=A0A816PUH1_9BILA|nr:unnamed protein product [Rotaria magnacalcarata]CAF4220249.1 unnamed protein product [Rotaria magnacalcarata]